MQFHLELDERQADRVFVTVCLDPDSDDAVAVQGVALELRSRSGDGLGPRLMLPIAGALHGPLCLQTEVRCRGELPKGARLHALAWWDGGQQETTCPTDPGTSLEVYAHGGGPPLPPLDLDDLPRALTDGEFRRLAMAFPWMRDFRPAGEAPEDRILEEHSDDIAGSVADDYDLSDEDRAFLEELLGDDDGLDAFSDDEAQGA